MPLRALLRWSPLVHGVQGRRTAIVTKRAKEIEAQPAQITNTSFHTLDFVYYVQRIVTEITLHWA
jgi:hypothetical protein